MDKQILNAIKNLEKRVVDLYKKIKGISLIPGPPGLQGLQGVPGIQGTVGPAGLNWQGAWDSNASYIEDDAVGYAGASWFCISPVSGGNAPDANTTNWALLASQGAPGLTGNTGPMPWNLPATVYNNGADYGYGDAVTYEGGYYYRTGNPNNPGYPPTPGSINGSWTPVADRGLPGVAPIKTRGQLYGSTTTYQEQTLLSYDINLIGDGTISSFFKLPDTAVIGKEVIIDVSGNNCQIYGFTPGVLCFETAVNGFNSQLVTKFGDLIKFTCTSNNFWLVEYLSRTSIPVPLITSQQVSATVGGANFSGLKYVRLYADAAGKSVKWNESVFVGMDLFVKNTSSFPIKFAVLNLNLSDYGDGYIYINPGEYYYFVREDSSTNTVTPFRLSNGIQRQSQTVNTLFATAPTLAYMNTNYSANVYYPVGVKIYFTNITTGPLMYTKTGDTTWISSPITSVV